MHIYSVYWKITGLYACNRYALQVLHQPQQHPLYVGIFLNLCLWPAVRLSELQLSKHSIIQTRDYPNTSPQSLHMCIHCILISNLNYLNSWLSEHFAWSQLVWIIEVALYFDVYFQNHTLVKLLKHKTVWSIFLSITDFLLAKMTNALK